MMLEWFMQNAVALSVAVVTGLTIFAVNRNDVKNLINGQTDMSKALREVTRSINEHQKEDTEAFATIRREFGETVLAIRTKVTDVELFTRDTFMRRDSGYKMQETLQGDLRSLGTNIGERLERMENKIDTKT